MNESIKKKLARLLLCIACSVACVAGCEPNEGCCQSLPTIERIEGTTVRVEFGGSSGTAVAIGEVGGKMYYATAKHCTTKRVTVFKQVGRGRFGNVLGANVDTEQDVKFGSVEFWRDGSAVATAKAETIWRSESGDCAIVATDDWPDSLVVSRASIEKGGDAPTRIFSGYPHRYGLSVMVGRKTSSRTFNGFSYGIVTTCPSPGHSGGPVISSGRVIGVTAMRVPGLNECDNAFHPFGDDFFEKLDAIGVEHDRDAIDLPVLRVEERK